MAAECYAGIIAPGFMFVHGKNPDQYIPSYVAPRSLRQPDTRLWLVITRRKVERFSGWYFEYLCLGPNHVLTWMTIGRWIHRVAQ